MSEVKNNLQNWNKLLEVLNTEVVNKNDFIDYFEKVVKLTLEIKKRQEEAVNLLERTYTDFLEKIKKDYNSNFANLKNQFKAEHQEIYREHEKMMKKIDRRLGELRDGNDADEDKIIESVKQQIKPSIEEIENNLPNLGKKIRDGLEILKDDERLDKSAIKGFEESIKELKEMISKIPRGSRGSIFGGRQLRGAKFSFAGNGSTTSFTLPAEPAMKGLAIWAYYQGQWLQPDVHFTISGKTFATTFTAQNQTTIEGFLVVF